MAYVATRQRPSTSAPSDGSRTITLRDSQPGEGDAAPDASGESVGRLRLRGAVRNRPRVVWRDDVIDNEGAGKKSSKICCIYHKPKKFDESSDEESDDSDSDSDASCSRGHLGHRRAHHHASDGDSDGQPLRSGDGGVTVAELEDSSDDANMYERQSGGKKGKLPARN
ncbi:uncharacterized protein FIBRA_04886 [Fibroporia radiculosa]|uniref:Type 1 phosphatases regulator n=1 Tax=Fibroporia radiculosa TaxID=599839 RepID=J4G843_9APHY|nr:uncharacterized protein FIBRA_04886 [Fibroporia radiculosa]CCM02778.1 predicted protein [Fibroporia radiculosa]